jgi:DNA-directed RNA polymerase subunit N
MIIPIRCFSCGKPVGHLWEEYRKQANAGKKADAVLDELGLTRMCCRGLFLTHVDLVKRVGEYKV